MGRFPSPGSSVGGDSLIPHEVYCTHMTKAAVSSQHQVCHPISKSVIIGVASAIGSGLPVSIKSATTIGSRHPSASSLPPL